jgi:uncharacterized protein (TIGR02246 family)
MSATVDAWIDGYRKAWASNDPEDIASLFTADAKYFSNPYSPPEAGREAIVAMWLADADESGTTTFESTTVAEIDGLAFVQGVSTYESATFSNLWVIRFDESGAASEFTDWWMRQADPESD